MRPFSKQEIIALVVTFLLLVGVSIPNFIVSLRRARDQVRRDDMGTLVHALAQYSSDFETYPLSSTDGRIMDCTKPGVKPHKDDKGEWVVDLIPCDWGKDAFTNLVSGSVYMSILPQDPYAKKGVKYLYFSDGDRYQIYAAMEGADEAEVDLKVIALKRSCGSRVCNVARSYNVPVDMSIEEYDKKLQQSSPTQ